MKSCHPPNQQGYILESNTKCLNLCCPTAREHHFELLHPPEKKTHKFINITLNKPKAIRAVPKVPPQVQRVPQPVMRNVVQQVFVRVRTEPEDEVVVLQQSFQENKSSFLMQIRNYNPNPQQTRQGEVVKLFKQVDSTKEMELSRKTVQSNNLSVLLDNLNNEIFSEMLVSSSVRDKIFLSGSLGSITEVRSDMERSEPTDSIINHLSPPEYEKR